MQIDINTILEDLKRDKSERTQISLDKLNALLEKRFNSGNKDFSIATIGRASKAEGGIGEVSIRNKSGEHFRLLIDAWAAKAKTTMKKPPVAHSRKKETPSDMELLKRLDDPALRAVFGQIIAERNKYKSENHILKNKKEVMIDMRPNSIINTSRGQSTVELLPALDGILVNSEIEALRDAIDENKIASKGWTVTNHGAVKDENGRPLFKAGFLTAIQKILFQI
ncbi:gamma-mobile-trio protein GmtX [Acinetobacter baumannii]|uniref:gamma-mobile-trio protein GmtX n=1 Tax=Acinetobacter TaxID=469 RepID=UPI00125F73D1|nr:MULTISPECIES: gamma-mobile-trio protein GmtX [Acinetobacter]